MIKSPSTGFNVIPVNMAVLTDLVKRTAGKVAYDYGAKPNPGAKPGSFRNSDCSGFVRWLLPLVATEHIDVPDGSWNQWEWCKRQGFKLTAYDKAGDEKDFRLRIAFIPKVGEQAGHVILLLNGYSIECCGGKGVCRRRWNEPVFLSNKKRKNRPGIQACFVLTDPMD